MSAIIPIARVNVGVRVATLADLPFIDGLQKQTSRQVGFMQTAALEGKIKAGHVLIAQDDAGEHLGYCIGNDQYFKRDDVGVIYQMNVVPGARRKLVGATLVKALFDRAAYGCKLFCCWCAQDIEANRFWESLGFVPLAFRAGSKGKDRVHIFWQKRIREGDCETPWWFPSKTTGGAIGEERLVLPIPPGKKWSDEMPRLLPNQKPALTSETTKPAPPTPRLPQRRFVRLGPPPSEPLADAVNVTVNEKPKRASKPKAKNDPKLVAAARELRDRYLEHVNADPAKLLYAGKYDVSRALPESHPPPNLLPALAPRAA